MKVEKLRGTRDFYPELMSELNSVFAVWRKVAKRFGYQEFDGPLLEPAKLWQLKSGSELPKQMYSFKDKGGREVAIRPELTPTLARMIAQKQKELTKPIRWFSLPRCWRYEAPQSGRLREFFQFNLDILGTDSMEADAEVITTVVEIMKEFGCNNDEFYVRINNRKLIQDILLGGGIKKSQLKEVCRIIDKRDKLSKDDFVLTLKDLNLNDKFISGLLDLLDLKELDQLSIDLSDEGKKGLEELKELFKYLDAFGVGEFCQFDLSLMRGLDYYTSTVFEVFDKSKEFRAIAGGGRYEDLISDFGGTPCPGIGYGMGDVVLSLFLKKIGKLPKTKRELDYYIAAVSENEVSAAIKLAQKLRKDNKIVELDVSNRKVGKQAKYASNIGAKNLIILGPEELKNKKAKVKNLTTGKETELDLN